MASSVRMWARCDDETRDASRWMLLECGFGSSEDRSSPEPDHVKFDVLVAARQRQVSVSVPRSGEVAHICDAVGAALGEDGVSAGVLVANGKQVDRGVRIDTLCRAAEGAGAAPAAVPRLLLLAPVAVSYRWDESRCSSKVQITDDGLTIVQKELGEGYSCFERMNAVCASPLPGGARTACVRFRVSGTEIGCYDAVGLCSAEFDAEEDFFRKTEHTWCAAALRRSAPRAACAVAAD